MVRGFVNEIDITIPVKEEEVPEATEETLAKGKELLGKAIAASGGAEAFEAIKTIQWKGDVTTVTPQGEMALKAEITMAFPDKLRADMNTPMGQISQIMNGDQVWLVMPQGTQPAPPQMREQMLENLWYNTTYLFAHAGNEGLTVQYLGNEDVNGQSCEVLRITPEGLKGAKLFLNSETLIPVKMSYQGMNMMGAPVASEEIYSDFRQVSGVKLAFKSITNQDGKKAQEATAAEIKINTEVDEKQFSVKE